MFMSDKFGAVISAIGVFFMIATAFFALQYNGERKATEEAVSALYRTAWTSAAAEKEAGDSVWVLMQMPNSLKPGFIGFVANKVKDDLLMSDHYLKEFVDNMPQKGIGIRLANLLVHQSNDGRETYGIKIHAVIEASPADRAGLCGGDRILAIDGEPMSVTPLRGETNRQTEALAERAITKIRANDQVLVLEIIREADTAGKKPKEFTVRISEHNAYDHLRDRQKIIDDWNLFSDDARRQLAVALQIGESISHGTDMVHIPHGVVLRDIIQRDRDLKEMQGQFVGQIEGFVTKCASK